MRRKAGAAKTSSEVCFAIAVRKASRQMTQLYDDALEPSGLKSTQFAILHESATSGSRSAKRWRASPSSGSTRAGMRRTIGYARTIIEQGIESGELIPTLDAGAEAEMMIATMEGSLMLAKLLDDSRYALQASAHFAVHASRMVRPPAPASWGVRVGPPLAADALLAELSAG